MKKYHIEILSNKSAFDEEVVEADEVVKGKKVIAFYVKQELVAIYPANKVIVRRVKD